MFGENQTQPIKTNTLLMGGKKEKKNQDIPLLKFRPQPE